MQASVQSQPPALFAAAPNGQAAHAAFDLTGVGIEEASSRAAFFVTGTSNNEPLKEALKKLGGAWNSRMKGYKFSADMLATVTKTIGLASNINLLDPSHSVTVHFTQTFQVNDGQMPSTEEGLKKLGLKKKQGNGNEWTGNLSQAGPFLQASSISLSK
jgi:hypothetical protein